MKNESDKTPSPMTLWRKNNPEKYQEQKQRQNESDRKKRQELKELKEKIKELSQFVKI